MSDNGFTSRGIEAFDLKAEGMQKVEERDRGLVVGENCKFGRGTKKGYWENKEEEHHGQDEKGRQPKIPSR